MNYDMKVLFILW